MPNLFRSAAVLTATCGLSLTGLMAPSHATTGQPLPAAEAGTLVAWGSEPGAFLGSTLDGVQAVDVAASNNGWGAAVKPDGSVVAWGTHPDTSSLSNVDSVLVSTAGLVALKKDHTVAGVDASTAGLADAPALTSVSAIALNNAAAAAVTGGTVQEWGAFAAVPSMAVPTDLTDGTTKVTSIAGGNLDFTAVKSDHTAENWGAVPTPVPDDVQNRLETIAGGLIGATSAFAAVLTDGSVKAWNATAEIPTPAALAGKKVVDLSVNGSIVALTSDGEVISWGADPANTLTEFPDPSNGVATAVAAGENDANGATFAAAIVTPFKAVTAPSIAGTAQVGHTLTATPAAFSLTPDRVTGQWLAGGSAIPGATANKLTVTSAYVGKHITYRSTATRGADTVTSDSAPTAAVPAVSKPPVTDPGHAKLKHDQAKLKHDQAKLKHLKKAYKKAHGHKKAKLHKKIVKL
jgi:hypothetical protein